MIAVAAEQRAARERVCEWSSPQKRRVGANLRMSQREHGRFASLCGMPEGLFTRRLYDIPGPSQFDVV